METTMAAVSDLMVAESSARCAWIFN